MGNWKIKTSNKTKEAIVEGLTTLLRACEPALEVETYLAHSGVQSGSVCNSWLVILLMVKYHIFPSQSPGQGLSTLMYLFSSSYIRSCFQHSSCRINSIAALRGTFILELMPPKHGWAFFITIVRENLVNRRGFMLICAQFVLHLAYSELTHDRFLQFLHMLLHIIVNLAQYSGNSGQIQPNPANIHKCFLPVL